MECAKFKTVRAAAVKYKEKNQNQFICLKTGENPCVNMACPEMLRYRDAGH